MQDPYKVRKIGGSFSIINTYSGGIMLELAKVLRRILHVLVLRRMELYLNKRALHLLVY